MEEDEDEDPANEAVANALRMHGMWHGVAHVRCSSGADAARGRRDSKGQEAQPPDCLGLRHSVVETSAFVHSLALQGKTRAT